MEELTKTIDKVAQDVQSFKDSNETKIENLEKANSELKSSNENLEKEIAEVKKQNLELSIKMNEISEKSEKEENSQEAVERKYYQELDSLLRGTGRNIEIKQESFNIARDFFENISKELNLSTKEREENFVKKMMEPAIQNNAFPVVDVKTLMNTYTGSEGGFAVTAPKRLETYRNFGKKLGLYSLVNRVQTSANQVTRLEQKAAEEGFWEGEVGSDKTTDVGMHQITIGTSIVKGVVPLTRTFVEDYQGNIYTFLKDYLEESLNNAIERALFLGDGQNGRPMGIAMYPELEAGKDYEFGKIKTVGVDDAKGLIDALLDQLILFKGVRCDLIVHPTTLSEIVKVKDGQGRPLVQPNVYLDGIRYSINGIAIYTSDYCPTMTTSNSKFAFLGDFKRAYDFVERTGRTVEFSPYVNNNEINNYILRQRAGGAVKGFDSIVAFKKN